jgi:two-component system phosphate regulon sensor histidine kinase PhoR
MLDYDAHPSARQMISRPGLLFALAAGLLAALGAALALPPLAAFLWAGLFALVGAAALRRRSLEPAAPPMPPPAAAAPPPDAGFGRALIERLPAALIVVSRTGRVAFANPAAEAALPRVRQAAHFASVIRVPAFVEAVNATLADGVEREVRFGDHQGRERSFEARVARLPAGGAFGTDASVIVQIDDRTETRRTEEMRSDFIANASHELRTPLASILGYIETLQHHARDDPAARERFLGIMAREAGRMRRLVDDLMSLSRIEMSEHLRPVEEWSLNAIAAESAAALLPMAEAHGVTLRIALDPVGAPVLGDRDQLAQVFGNLIENAMKYAGPGATVEVRPAAASKAHPGRVGVTVSDDGPGIPREHIHRLTERFYRVNAASSRNNGGTGLGLAIVKHILNRHQGRLEIASTLGAGSAFTVWLPRAVADGEANRTPTFTKVS